MIWLLFSVRIEQIICGFRDRKAVGNRSNEVGCHLKVQQAVHLSINPQGPVVS